MSLEHYHGVNIIYNEKSRKLTVELLRDVENNDTYFSLLWPYNEEATRALRKSGISPGELKSGDIAAKIVLKAANTFLQHSGEKDEISPQLVALGEITSRLVEIIEGAITQN